jgi:hypothetical protein
VSPDSAEAIKTYCKALESEFPLRFSKIEYRDCVLGITFDTNKVIVKPLEALLIAANALAK